MIKFWVNIIKVYFCFLISLKYISLFGKKKVEHVCQSQFPSSPLPLFPSWCLCGMYVNSNFPIHPSRSSHLGVYAFSLSVSLYLFCKSDKKGALSK